MAHTYAADDPSNYSYHDYGDRQFYRILVDGTPWIDSDGQREWTFTDTISLTEVTERQGYTDIVIEPID